MPVLSRRRSATGPASLGPHPGQMGGWYCTRISKSVRGLGGTGTPRELNTRRHRIQNEVRELRVVNRKIHAEAILEASADDRFVDQRIAFAVHLLKAPKFGLDSGERRTVI
jgi:hypothetical protein